MVKMTKYDLKPIVKTYYDALEEGTILGRKCTRCGHIEFPPYLCCNECGGLDTEWVDLTNMRGIVKQALPTKGAFGDPEFRNTQGDYFAVEIEVPGMDPFNASLLHVDYDKYEEFDQYIQEHEVEVKPLLFQDEDMKVVAWELVEDNGFKKIPEIKAPEPKKEETKTATATATVDLSNDATTQTVIEAAADAYGVDAASITLATDIREDLSNESMKMIVMISTIEDQLNVTIEIQEASNLNTIADFVNVVKERLGEETIASNAPVANNSDTATAAQSSEELDDVAKAAGGLKIIGTERHESRRIDNQLRGRSGRQGDPGESRFYISLEDDLMRLFGSEKLMGIFKSLGVPENEQIEHKMLSSAIEKAQKKIEGNNYGIRKNLLDYDQVNNEQREIIYKERRRVLDGESMRDTIFKMIADTIDNTVDLCIGENTEQSEWDLTELNEMLLSIMPVKAVTKERVEKISKNELKQQLKEEAVKLYEEKEAEFPEEEQIRELERVVLLKVIDQKWMDHIDDMDQLREGIGLQAYGQRDPKVEYKMAAYDMFNEMLESIQQDTVRLLFHVRVEQKVEREQVAKVTGTNKDESGPRKPVQRAERKIYPNDPCPCGSGKKYKQCCGRKPV